MVEAAAQVACALGKTDNPAALGFITPECNSFRLGLMEPRPISEIFGATERAATTLFVLENDLFRRGSASAIASLLEEARHLVVFDHLQNATNRGC